jgi:hypothetical protein
MGEYTTWAVQSAEFSLLPLGDLGKSVRCPQFSRDDGRIRIEKTPLLQLLPPLGTHAND